MWGKSSLSQGEITPPFGKQQVCGERCSCKAKSRGEKKAFSSRNHTAFWETNGSQGVLFSRGQVSRGQEGYWWRDCCGGKAVFFKSKSHCSLGNKSSARSVVLAKPNLTGKRRLLVIRSLHSGGGSFTSKRRRRGSSFSRRRMFRKEQGGVLTPAAPDRAIGVLFDCSTRLWWVPWQNLLPASARRVSFPVRAAK